MKKLLILSGKGGTGKTTTAAAFAVFSGARALADCDVDAPNLHLALMEKTSPEEKDFYGGKKAEIDPALCIGCGSCLALCRFDAIVLRDGKASVDVISCEGCGVCKLGCPKEAIRLEKDVAGLLSLYRGDRIFSTAELKMGRGNSGKLVTEVKFSLFGAARDQSLAIIDGSPGIGCPVIASISGMDLVLAVAEPTLSGISDLARLVQTARRQGVSVAVCVNKYDVNPRMTDEIEEFCKKEQLPFLGRIPYDKALSSCQSFWSEDFQGKGRDALLAVYEKAMLLLREA